jgi:hypothetical protein
MEGGQDDEPERARSFGHVHCPAIERGGSWNGESTAQGWLGGEERDVNGAQSWRDERFRNDLHYLTAWCPSEKTAKRKSIKEGEKLRSAKIAVGGPRSNPACFQIFVELIFALYHTNSVC